MAFYELVCVFPADIKTKKKLIQEIESWFKEIKAQVKEKKEWGKRELAYPIRKNNQGFYFFWLLEAEPKKINVLETRIRLENQIIRHLLTKKGGG